MCGLSQRSVASMMPAMRAVPKAAVAWFGLLVALLGLAISTLLVAAVGFIALVLVAGYVVSIASLMGPRPARG